MLPCTASTPDEMNSPWRFCPRAAGTCPGQSGDGGIRPAPRGVRPAAGLASPDAAASETGTRKPSPEVLSPPRREPSGGCTQDPCRNIIFPHRPPRTRPLCESEDRFVERWGLGVDVNADLARFQSLCDDFEQTLCTGAAKVGFFLPKVSFTNSSQTKILWVEFPGELPACVLSGFTL